MKSDIKIWLTITAIVLTLLYWWFVNRELNRQSAQIFGFDPIYLLVIAVWIAFPLILLISLFNCHTTQTLILIWGITIVVYFFMPVKWEIDNVGKHLSHRSDIALLEMLDDPQIDYEQIKNQSQQADVELIILQLEALFRQRTDIVQNLIDEGYPLESLNLNIHHFLERYYYNKNSFLTSQYQYSNFEQRRADELPKLPNITAYKSVKFMIEHGIDVNAPGLGGGNGLISALWSNDSPTINLLCEAGIEFVQCGQNNCSITAAIYNDNIEIAKICIERGLDINYIDPDNSTPLCMYLSHNMFKEREIKYATIKFLLDNGANPNLASNNKRTPLYYCIENDIDIEIIKLLISHGAKADCVDSSNETLLIKAARSLSVDVVKLLIDNGADVDLMSDYGFDPLSQAVDRRNLEIVKLLVDNGASLDHKYRGDATIFSIVDKEREPEIWNYLVSKGAKEE